MICSSCKCERLVNDFINNQNICFRCMYQKKIKKLGKKRNVKKPKCRICGQMIIRDKNAKRRQRTVFCSHECAEIGNKELINKHWTRQVRSGSFV